MRCPHCAGELPAGSRFCGICGRGIAHGVDGRTPGPGEPVRRPRADEDQRLASQMDSVSLFELPESRAGRRARMALILILDAILAGAGVVMLLAYFESRREGLRPGADANPALETTKGEAGSPARVTPSATEKSPAPPAGSGAATPPSAPSPGARRANQPTDEPAAPEVERNAKPAAAPPGGGRTSPR